MVVFFSFKKKRRIGSGMAWRACRRWTGVGSVVGVGVMAFHVASFFPLNFTESSVGVLAVTLLERGRSLRV